MPSAGLQVFKTHGPPLMIQSAGRVEAPDGAGGAGRGKSAEPQEEPGLVTDLGGARQEREHRRASPQGRAMTREAREDPYRAEELAPVRNFPHGFSWFETVAPRGVTRKPGADSRVLGALIAQSCSGWPTPPTASEAERTMKARVAEGRAHAISGLIIREAPLWMIIEGEREQAWSLQDLAWWIHKRRIRALRLIRWMNVISREYVARHRSVRSVNGPR